jgi:hypothetical protein
VARAGHVSSNGGEKGLRRDKRLGIQELANFEEIGRCPPLATPIRRRPPAYGRRHC